MATATHEINAPAPTLAPKRCEQCQQSDASVWLRADVTYFSGAVCDGCALQQIARVAMVRGGTYTLGRVAGAVLVTTIAGIDSITAYARECLDGVTGDCDLAAMTTVPGAQTARLGRVAGAVLVTTIAGIDSITAYARECLDGVTGDCDLAAMTTVPGAQTAIATALSSRLRRPLSPSELLAVHEAARAEVVARWKAKREGMLETERALHAPFGSGLRQRIG